MSKINVSSVFEVNIEMTLNRAEANQLLHFLKHAPSPAPIPSQVGNKTVWKEPATDIVRRLANAIEPKLVA